MWILRNEPNLVKPKFLVFLLQDHQNNLDVSVLYVAPELKMTVRM
jgi:hypothetical protein